MTAESLFAELEPPEETHSVGTYRLAVILSFGCYKFIDHKSVASKLFSLLKMLNSG